MQKNAQILSYTLVCFAVCLTALFVSRKIDESQNVAPQNLLMIMVIGINVQVFASSFECSGGLIKCSSSFGKKRAKFALHSCLFCSLPYSLVCVAKNREVLKCRPPKCTYDNGHWYQCVGLCELFRVQGGLIKCSSSFGNMWILLFSLLPCVWVCVCVCVTMLKLFNVTLLFVLKFAL